MSTPINLSTLQDTIGLMLADDAAVTAVLGSHDARVQGASDTRAQFPYLTIGGDEVLDSSVQGLTAKSVRLPIHIWTSERGFGAAKSIEAAIVALLDDNAFSVVGMRVVSCFHAKSNFMRDPEDGVRHGVAEFDIEVEALS